MDAPEDKVGRRRPWRLVLRALHRDLGYLAVGLTLVYAVSGVAVNHREDWDYNRSTDEVRTGVGTPSALLGVEPRDLEAEGKLARERQDELVAKIGAALGRMEAPRKAFWRGRDRLSLFYAAGDDDVVDYRPATGIAEHVEKSDRFLLRELNYLHLNEGKSAWTWIADGFAVVLTFLALSGLLLIRGKKGFFWRGAVLMLVGLLVPIIAVWVMR